MVDIVEEMRAWARQIRRNNEVAPHATSGKIAD